MLPLQAEGRRLDVTALLLDLDRTLTDERLRVVPSALKAIDRARDHGIKAFLVTGRNRRQMLTRDALLHRFDGYVFESGGLIGSDPLRLRPLPSSTAAIERLSDWLDAEGVDFERGDTSLSISVSDAAALDRYDAPRGAFARHKNRDRIDVTPPGIDKGAGVKRLLSARKGSTTVAFADGENDVSLFKAADYRVAVANAVPELKALADETTAEYGGRGVARFLRQRLLPEVEA